jgi:small neutral amino acid transporter SnatA (MarC family)
MATPTMDLFKPLVALLAIVNPIGVVPFFIHFTQNFTREQRQRTILISAFTAFCVIALSALAGLKIIEFFGISIASFQVGGGTLLLISALPCSTPSPPKQAGRRDRGRPEGRRRREHRGRAADRSRCSPARRRSRRW